MAHTLTVVLLILLWKLLMIGSKEANVTCMVHDDCLLPCSFRPTGTVVIHWYKQQIPVHSFYYHKDQFGLQNKHFSGRTCLFNSHIPHGNASLLLRRVKVQDKGRYKCYTSTRKGNQELFVNLDVKAHIQSVVLELSDETLTCSSHNVYPVPQVRWATDPPSAREALQNSTTRTTDHKGLFTVESTLRILGNLSDHTYFCSFISADKSQVWTASRRNQESRTQEEGHTLSIPCVAPHTLHNFSLVWTFTSSADPRLILRYDSRSGHTVNQWEGQAELDQDRLPLGDGSLLLRSPDSEEHSGTYTCTFSGLQNRHVVQTGVNITIASFSVDERSVRRSWWSTLASAAFVLFSIVVALPHCVRQRVMVTSSHRYNGMGLIEVGPHKDQNPAASHEIRHQAVGCSRQLQRQPEDGAGPDTADVCAVDVSGDSETQQEERHAGAEVEGDDVEGGSKEPVNCEADPSL